MPDNTPSLIAFDATAPVPKDSPYDQHTTFEWVGHGAAVRAREVLDLWVELGWSCIQLKPFESRAALELGRNLSGNSPLRHLIARRT